MSSVKQRKVEDDKAHRAYRQEAIGLWISGISHRRMVQETRGLCDLGFSSGLGMSGINSRGDKGVGYVEVRA